MTAAILTLDRPAELVADAEELLLVPEALVPAVPGLVSLPWQT